jgi:DNA mismatch repair protein MutS2
MAERRAAEEAEVLDRLNAEARADVEKRASEGQKPESGAIEVGVTVAVVSLGGKAGTVLELRGNEAVVSVGAMKLTVPLKTLRRVSKKKIEPLERAVPLMGDQPELDIKREVDVRGMRVGEVDDAVIQALDAIVSADLGALTIIHGKGTGALRERVTQLLKKDRRVKTFRLGLWNEGGAGVTIVEIA